MLKCIDIHKLNHHNHDFRHNRNQYQKSGSLKFSRRKFLLKTLFSKNSSRKILLEKLLLLIIENFFNILKFNNLIIEKDGSNLNSTRSLFC